MQRFCLAQACLIRPICCGCNDVLLDSPIPRGFCAERFFLHLFSGRRRRGDFQHFFDQLVAPEGVWIQVISLDVVLSEGVIFFDQPLERFGGMRYVDASSSDSLVVLLVKLGHKPVKGLLMTVHERHVYSELRSIPGARSR